MALTQAFKQTVRARVQRDGRYREELFTGAINACLTGDSASGKAMLREGSEYPFSSAFIWGYILVFLGVLAVKSDFLLR